MPQLCSRDEACRMPPLDWSSAVRDLRGPSFARIVTIPTAHATPPSHACFPIVEDRGLATRPRVPGRDRNVITRRCEAQDDARPVVGIHALGRAISRTCRRRGGWGITLLP